jgi:hypothetical protein
MTTFSKFVSSNKLELKMNIVEKTNKVIYKISFQCMLTPIMGVGIDIKSALEDLIDKIITTKTFKVDKNIIYVPTDLKIDDRTLKQLNAIIGY